MSCFKVEGLSQQSKATNDIGTRSPNPPPGLHCKFLKQDNLLDGSHEPVKECVPAANFNPPPLQRMSTYSYTGNDDIFQYTSFRSCYFSEQPVIKPAPRNSVRTAAILNELSHLLVPNMYSIILQPELPYRTRGRVYHCRWL